MKIGGFEMHVKRNIKSAEAIMPVALPTEVPPIPSKPMTESAPATPPPPQKTTPFTNISLEKSTKLAALEGSGASGYVLVSCQTVGAFRKSRTLKGKKQPNLIKERLLGMEIPSLRFCPYKMPSNTYSSDFVGGAELLGLWFASYF